MKLDERPLRRLLDADASEEELERVWNGVERLRARQASRRWPAPHWPWVAFALGGALLVALLLRYPPLAPPAGALSDGTGHALTLMRGSQTRATVLSDGSHVELSPDAELEVLDNDGSTFACALRRGGAAFDVVPGGPRRWRIEAALVRVEVVGTRFRVDRREDNVAIAVEHGVVVVRGEQVRDGVQRLTAGSRLEVSTAPLSLVGSAQASIGLPAPAVPGLPSSPPTNRSEPGSSPSAQATPTDWLALADAQRRRGDLQSAIQTLRRAVERAPDDAHRAMAAFTLGKLLLDGASRPTEAEAAFRTCLGLAAPSAVAEDALARLVEAQARSAKVDAARASAREYERRYPNGRRLADVRRWADTR